jgi:transcriptional regulator with XRE-family HTH domain
VRDPRPLASSPRILRRQAPSDAGAAEAPVAGHRPSANLTAGDGTKNGLPAPKKEPVTNHNNYLTGKTPYKEQRAELSGFSQQYISGLDQGRRNLTVVSLYELATALGVTHMELVLAIDEESRSPRARRIRSHARIRATSD